MDKAGPFFPARSGGLLAGADGRTLYLAMASTDEAYAAEHQTGSILSVRFD